MRTCTVRHLSYVPAINGYVVNITSWYNAKQGGNSGSLYKTPDWFLTRNESPRHVFDLGFFTLFVEYLFPRLDILYVVYQLEHHA